MVINFKRHVVAAGQRVWLLSAIALITLGTPIFAQAIPSDCPSCCGNGACFVNQPDACSLCDSCGLWDNLSLFAGTDGSKQPQDFGVNANFGQRFHANWGVPLSTAHGLGLQIGAGVNETDNAVQVFERIEGSRSRTQVFTTVGLFQRSGSGWNWAVAYDYLHQDSFDDFDLGQWRGQISYWYNECTELGVRAAISEQRDAGRFGTVPVSLDPISQGTVFLRRFWPSTASTTFWLGVAEGHGEANVALGDLPPSDERFVYGADVHCPLNDYLAIFGEANFIQPADTGTVDAYLGVVFYPGGTRNALKRRFAPVLPVANNNSFSIDLTR